MVSRTTTARLLVAATVLVAAPFAVGPAAARDGNGFAAAGGEVHSPGTL
jgi:hypothetical protein